jgi:hypothetical protein
MDDRLWSVIRANVAPEGRDREEALVRWWADEHQPEYVAMDGFQRAWLTRVRENEGAQGDPGQTYMAVYDIDAISHFNDALNAGPPWGPWEDYVGRWVIDWTRTYLRVRSHQGNGGTQGSHWAIVRSELDLATGADRERFEAWYDDTHIPELLGFDGVLHAWRLEVVPDETELGPRGLPWWAVYEVESPQHFADARRLRLERGAEPWDGIWLEHLKSWTISFHEIVNRSTR